MIIRVLIINRQLVFAVTIKQALEQTGAFEVHPFTDPNAAMEYLRTHPHDVALVDFSITVMPGPEIVQNLRAIQPEIAIIVSPSQPNKVVRDLEIQQSIDPPFSARSIIPLIEHAAQQVNQPMTAVTQTFVDSQNPEDYPTDVLGSDGPSEKPPAFSPQAENQPAQTYILGERDSQEMPVNQEHTRLLSDEEVAEQDQMTTRMFDEEPGSPPPPEMPPSLPDEAMSTHMLDDGDDEDFPTRMLPDYEESTDDEIARLLNLPPEDMVTRIFDEDEADAPLQLPEFTTLDDVLNSEAPSSLYEPPSRDEDTPSVPEVDSDAVRQYLATETAEHDGVFDQMLGEISEQPEDVQPSQPSSSSGFDELVRSMSADQPHTPLPDRHQQFVDFILTGGMDGLLDEIEKTQTGPLDPNDVPDTLPEESRETSSFEKLSLEEPPLPTLEESGTVGDLMIGVSDTSFRNVLNMMRGEELVEETDEHEATTAEDDYAAYFDNEVAEEDEPAPSTPKPQPRREQPPEPDYDDEDDSYSIPAQLILETAMDESTPPDAFSINSLLGSIEQQLTEHKPDIRPLPSWNINQLQQPSRSQRRRKGRSNRYIEEPDFLPEEFPTDDMPAAVVEPEPGQILDSEPAEAEEFDTVLEPIEDQAAEAEDLALFESLGDSLAQPDAAIIHDEPEDLVPSLEDTSPVEVPSEPLPELPHDESHFLETVLGEAAYAEPEYDDEDYDPSAETVQGDAVDWDPAAMFQESAWNEEAQAAAEAEAEAVHAEVEDEDDWTMPEEIGDEEYAELEADYDGVNDFEAAFDGVIAPTDAEVDEDLLPEPEQDPDYAYELSEPDLSEDSGFEDDWAITVDEDSSDETQLVETAAAVPAAPAATSTQEFEVRDRDDPYIAQIALSLTQVSLELATEATILTNDEEIVAIAGDIDAADVDEIRDVIADDWDADSGDQARVRFITLASSNKDYMLYSRRTVGDFTLSMLFAGTTQLRDIRRQGKRLVEALEAVPDQVAEHEVPELAAVPAPAPATLSPPEDETFQPFTYLWLRKDADQSFEDQTQRAISAGLSMQLQELGWQIKTLQAQGEYVYVRADVPGERAAHEIISDLKQRAADIAQGQEPDLDLPNLWADSYLVMMPGRELDPEEIDQFIDFERLY